MPVIEHEFTSDIVCPWCGYEEQDSCEHNLDEDECREIECGECLKKFTVEMNVTIDYSTTKIEEE